MAGEPNTIDWDGALRSAILEGLSVRQLSEKLGVTTSTVHKYELRFGLRLKRVRVTAPHKGNATGIDWLAELALAQSDGTSTTQLASKLGVSLGAILSAEDRTGIRLVRKRPDPRRVGPLTL